jgi:hypothetical protein
MVYVLTIDPSKPRGEQAEETFAPVATMAEALALYAPFWG